MMDAIANRLGWALCYAVTKTNGTVFDVANAAYTVLQWTHAHCPPELAGRVFNVRRALLVVDATLLARDCVHLDRNLKGKVGKERPYARAAIVATSLFVGAAGVFLVHRYLKQAVDLKGLLIAAGEGLKVQWDAPRLHKVGELLMAGRISVNLCSALATAGQQRLFHLAIASTQASTLGKMFQWPWVKIEKTFTKSAIDAFPQSTARCQDFKEIKVSAHALLVPGRLSTTLQSACHYITNVFNSSRFYLQSSVRTLSLSKGEASREYYYWVFAGGSGPQGDAPSYMGRLSGWALGLFSPRKVSIYYSSS